MIKINTKTIIIVSAILVVVVILFFFRSKIAKAIKSNKLINSVIENEEETAQIENNTGLTKTEIDNARQIAKFIADKMGTHIDTPFYEPALFGTPKNAIINSLNRIETEAQAVLVASIYENKMTENRSLRTDLDSLFTRKGLSEIDFNYAIK